MPKTPVSIAVAIVASGDISGVETNAVGFFPVDALPPLSMGRILPEQIRKLYELRCNGGMEVIKSAFGIPLIRDARHSIRSTQFVLANFITIEN